MSTYTLYYDPTDGFSEDVLRPVVQWTVTAAGQELEEIAVRRPPGRGASHAPEDGVDVLPTLVFQKVGESSEVFEGHAALRSWADDEPLRTLAREYGYREAGTRGGTER